METVLVTGGAGFVGSQLTERLLADGATVTVVDDLSTGTRDAVPGDATLIERDLRDPDALKGVLSPEYDAVFHLAASKAVDVDRPRAQFEGNARMTYTVLDAVREHEIPRVGFTSSSTVYGDAPRPTPEDYAPLEPISVYGAAKLADEALCSSVAHTTSTDVYTFRFANIVGPRLRGAVIPDFVEKLRADPDTLEILGDGRQSKSYMHVSECVDAMCAVLERASGPVATYNLGTRTTTSVDRIADIVCQELGCDPTREYTGGERGWEGDVPRMRLSIEKVSALGWEPTMESERAVRRATRELLEEVW